MNVPIIIVSVLFVSAVIYQSLWSVSRIEIYYSAIKKKYRRKELDFFLFIIGGTFFYFFLLLDFGVIQGYEGYILTIKKNIILLSGSSMMLFSYHISQIYEGDRIRRLGICHADSSSIVSQRNAFYFFFLFGLLFSFMHFHIHGCSF